MAPAATTPTAPAAPASTPAYRAPAGHWNAPPTAAAPGAPAPAAYGAYYGAAAAPNAAAGTKKPAAKKSKKKIWISVIAVVLCLGLAAGAYFLFFRGGGEAAADYPQTPKEALERYVTTWKSGDVEEYYLVSGFDFKKSSQKQMQVFLADCDNDYSKLRAEMREAADYIKYIDEAVDWDARIDAITSLNSATSVYMDMQKTSYKGEADDIGTKYAEQHLAYLETAGIYELTGYEKEEAMQRLENAFSVMQSAKTGDSAYVPLFELSDVIAIYRCPHQDFGKDYCPMIIETKQGCFAGEILEALGALYVRYEDALDSSPGECPMLIWQFESWYNWNRHDYD